MGRSSMLTKPTSTRKCGTPRTPVLVDFYADRCPVCVRFLPELEAFAREHPKARIVKVDADRNRSLAMQCGVNVIPYLIVFKGGKPIVRHPGPADDEELADMLGQ